MRRNIQVLGWTLIWSGIFLFGYLGWQLIGTDVVNARVQVEASQQLHETFAAARVNPPVVEQVTPDPSTGQTRTIPFHNQEVPELGAEFAKISIPKVGLDTVMFEGVDTTTLRQGPGHMPGTPLPGLPGNAVVSGHRTTHGRPFFDLDQLQPGDRILVETVTGTHIYEVRESFVVQPTDVWVTDNKPGAWLTLTTCNPKFSARQRLIITAEMIAGPNFEFVQYLSRL